jgi:putative ABC transport system permease protein
MPLTSGEDAGIRFDGRTGELSGTTANYFRVTPAFLCVLEIPLIRGRLITDQDTSTSSPVVLINETMARRFFPDEDPIGKRLDIAGPTYLREIVGVVGDVKHENLRMPAAPQVYEPFVQKPGTSIRVLLRTASNPLNFVDIVRQEVRAIDNAQPISDARELSDVVARTLTRDRFSVFVLGGFACLALIVAAVGLYGLVAYTVKQRTNEISVRMALGAEPRGIQRLVVVQSLRMVVLGVGLGLAVSLMLTGVVRSLLYEVQPSDPTTFAAAAVLQIGVGFAAAVIPARRAARVDPALALRAE